MKSFLRAALEPAEINRPDRSYLLESLAFSRGKSEPIRTAVCWPASVVSLAGAVEAAAKGWIAPIFIGSATEMMRAASAAKVDLGLYPLIDTATEAEAATTSVELCRAGAASAMMKGSLPTEVLLSAALQRDAGLQTSRRMSHIFILEAPLCDRTLFITDAAINIYPTLEVKVHIVQNAIDLAHILGLEEPRVAILSAVETVSPKILSTVDAAALCKMAERGQIEGAVLDGPLAFDTAVSAEAAQVKNLKSAVAGHADILVAPDLESGNMLAKQLEYLGGARLAGIVMGARVPIILTSRADTVESRIASCAVASLLVARAMR